MEVSGTSFCDFWVLAGAVALLLAGSIFQGKEALVDAVESSVYDAFAFEYKEKIISGLPVR